MSLWFLIPLLLFVAVFQTTLMPAVPLIEFRVELPLLLVVAQGLVGVRGTAATWGFILGLFLDVASGLPFGANTLALTVVGLSVDLGQRYFFRDNLLAPPAVTIVATLLNHLIALGIFSLTNSSISWNDYLLRVTLPVALLNTAALALVFFPMQWFYRRIGSPLEQS